MAGDDPKKGKSKAKGKVNDKSANIRDGDAEQDTSDIYRDLRQQAILEDFADPDSPLYGPPEIRDENHYNFLHALNEAFHVRNHPWFTTVLNYRSGYRAATDQIRRLDRAVRNLVMERKTLKTTKARLEVDIETIDEENMHVQAAGNEGRDRERTLNELIAQQNQSMSDQKDRTDIAEMDLQAWVTAYNNDLEALAHQHDHEQEELQGELTTCKVNVDELQGDIIECTSHYGHEFSVLTDENQRYAKVHRDATLDLEQAEKDAHAQAQTLALVSSERDTARDELAKSRRECSDLRGEIEQVRQSLTKSEERCRVVASKAQEIDHCQSHGTSDTERMPQMTPIDLPSSVNKAIAATGEIQVAVGTFVKHFIDASRAQDAQLNAAIQQIERLEDVNADLRNEHEFLEIDIENLETNMAMLAGRSDADTEKIGSLEDMLNQSLAGNKKRTEQMQALKIQVASQSKLITVFTKELNVESTFVEKIIKKNQWMSGQLVKAKEELCRMATKLVTMTQMSHGFRIVAECALEDGRAPEELLHLIAGLESRKRKTQPRDDVELGPKRPRHE